LESDFVDSVERPRRVALTPASAVYLTQDAVINLFRPGAGARRVTRRWHQGLLARLGVIAGVGVTAVALAAFTVPSTAPIVGIPLNAAATTPRTVVAGTLSQPVAEEVAAQLVSQTRMYTNAKVTVRSKASDKGKELVTLNWGTRLLATAEVSGKYRKIEVDDIEGWVLDADLIKETDPLAAGVTMQPCDRGSKIEAKLRTDTIKIYRSVCALFPGVNSYGGWRAGGRAFHKNGRAVDIMLTPGKESAMGWQIAEFITAHYKEFNIDHVIFEQKIWTPSNQRWRKMADRGSTTANHYDHVHAAVKA
jgi:hypothetical protein